MIKNIDKSNLDSIMKIWLETNISTHNFIPREYWTDNYEAVKNAMLNAEVLIYEEDVIKGFIGITDKSYIAGLFIEKQFQGDGIGSKLIEECKRRYPSLELDVYEKNAKAVDFYIKHGFEIMQVKEDTVTNKKEYKMLWKA